ncbi:RNA 2',3'-cyclic phosphodiesterase [Pararhodobacter aggregans]|uniref:RNA 2',3'-cyclic phosphodiesterase n=1 Tax=Pararhodobacter aggregans TaxID=404875 RepID=UPI003A9091EA
MIRAFLALPLPEPILDRLTIAQHRLPLPRPLEPETFHITLVFLDRQPEPVLEDFHHALEAMARYAPLLRLDGLGSFGGNDPDAVFARIAGDARLSALHMRTARAAREVGIEVPGRKYVPHVTLGRFRKGEAQPEALARAMQAVEPLTSNLWLAEEMVLYRSTLRPEGPVYDPLARYKLG